MKQAAPWAQLAEGAPWVFLGDLSPLSLLPEYPLMNTVGRAQPVPVALSSSGVLDLWVSGKEALFLSASLIPASIKCQASLSYQPVLPPKLYGASQLPRTQLNQDILSCENGWWAGPSGHHQGL